MCKDTGLAMALYQVPPSSRGQSPQIMEIGMIFEQIDCFNDFFHSVFSGDGLIFFKGVETTN